MCTLQAIMEVLPDDALIRIIDESKGQGPTPYLMDEMTIIKGRNKMLRKGLGELLLQMPVRTIDAISERCERNTVIAIYLDTWYGMPYTKLKA